MRLVLLGLCVISLIQIAVAVPLSFEQLRGTTDDEDLMYLLQRGSRVKREASTLRRERREASAPFANPNDGGGTSTNVVFTDTGSTEDEGSGGGSGDNPGDTFST